MERRRRRRRRRRREREESSLRPSTDDSFCSARFFATTPSSHPRGWMIYDRPRDTGHPQWGRREGGRGGEGEKETGRGRYILIPEEFLMYVRVHLCFKAAIVSAKLGRIYGQPPSKIVVTGIWLFFFYQSLMIIVFHLSKGKMEKGWKGFLALWIWIQFMKC